MFMRNSFEYLSNFFRCSVTVRINGEDITFPHTEAAFQAYKCPERAKEFCTMTPMQAKKYGKQVPLRADWEDIKLGVMLGVCRAKFNQHPDLMTQLVNCEWFIAEDNTWGDKYWGRVNGVGMNYLGAVLMKIRDEERKRLGLPKAHNREL